jgi:hypothetical protein
MTLKLRGSRSCSNPAIGKMPAEVLHPVGNSGPPIAIASTNYMLDDCYRQGQIDIQQLKRSIFPLILIHLDEQQHNYSVTHGPPLSRRHVDSSTNNRTSASKLTTIAQSFKRPEGSVLLRNRKFTGRYCFVESSDHNLASAHFAGYSGPLP